jgi:hypothetical protein
LATLVCCFFCCPAFAQDVTENGDLANEEITETVQTDVTTNETTVEDNAKEIVQNAIDIITNSAFLSTLATVLTGCCAIIVFLVKSINSIKSLIHSKADAKTMVETVNNGVKEISDNFVKTVRELNTKLDMVEQALENEKANAKQLSVILSTFILHTKLGTSAKAEILKYIEGLKEYNGTAVEIIEGIEEAIAKAEAEEEKIETPALEQVCAIALE